MTIRDIFIAARDINENEYPEPPRIELGVSVMAMTRTLSASRST